MEKYRAGVIGLGWMGMLYDMAERIGDFFNIDDVDRPTPELEVHRKIYHHAHPGKEGLPNSYSEAFWDRPDVDLVAAADRDQNRLKAFEQRYGIKALYTDAVEMLQTEKLDLVAVATNVKGRADLTCLAVENGAKGIVTAKPMAHTLEETDRMIKVCADAGVPLNCGAISTTHPSFGRAKELIVNGTIGNLLSIEAPRPGAQHQSWSYFLDSSPAWVIGIGDRERRGTGTDEFNGPGGSDEFAGQGMMVTDTELAVYFRPGAPHLRLTGTTGEIVIPTMATGFKLWQDIETTSGVNRVEAPWPDPQFVGPYGAVYGLADVIDCIEERLDEPKNSGRRVAVALEVEIALKQSSARGGVKVDLPLADRSLGLNYDWFR
jgi:predicted dehydrogenase